MSEFFAMSGYGYFIWMSYGVMAVFMVAEVILLISSKKSVVKRLTRLARVQNSELGHQSHNL